MSNRMDPQDVPHLFDCTAHPNNLSPVNLWYRPIETIRELTFLDTGNLDQQMRMVEEGIQQQTIFKHYILLSTMISKFKDFVFIL